MSNFILIIVTLLTIIVALLVILNRTKIIQIKKNNLLALLYFILVVGLIYISLALFGGIVWEKITAYQESVLSESEEQCKRDDAPFWCNL